MKKFYKEVDLQSRKEMTDFLQNHFRYDTMNHWNRSTSYACNMKIYNLGLTREIEDKLYDLISCEDAYDTINEMIDEFGEQHDWKWQVGFNGRSGGYLVLYSGGWEWSEYNSYCVNCGQRSFEAVEETGRTCGRCGRESLVNFKSKDVYAYPGKSIDMHEDFDSWSIEELKERVKLVQEFDHLADRIVEEAAYIAENYHVEEETYSVPTSRKILVENYT